MTIIDTINSIPSMDGIELITKKENINKGLFDSGKYFFEFDSEQELMTVSTRLIREFSINGRAVNFDNINDFLIKNNALIDGEFIIVPNYSLSLYIDFNEKVFLEILIYSSSIKNLYEKKTLKQYEDYVDDKSQVLISSEAIFVPFTSVGEYNFGESEEYFLSQTKLPYHDERGVNNKKYYDCNDIVFRFDQDKLSQLYINNPNVKIVFNGININTLDGINILLNQYSVIKSRSHNILPDIGVAIKNRIKTIADIELYFFDQDLIKYWQNIYRPITSW